MTRLAGWHRRAACVLLWGLLWLLLAAGIVAGLAHVGERLLGDVGGWEYWLRMHSGYLLAWRLVLYAATAWGWWWMRHRLLRREPGAETRRRLLRVECAALLVVAMLEGSQWLRRA